MSYGRITTETMTDIADAIRDKTGSEAQVTPTQMPERIRSIQTGSPDAVLYVEQELTEEEKAQARENIGAVGEDDIPIVPTDISAFNNDSGYQTAQDVATAIAQSGSTETVIVTLNYSTTPMTASMNSTQIKAAVDANKRVVLHYGGVEIPYLSHAATLSIFSAARYYGTPTGLAIVVNEDGTATATSIALVQSVNGQTGAVELSAADVGALPSSTIIPSKTSDLQNDSGYQTAPFAVNIYEENGSMHCSATPAQLVANAKNCYITVDGDDIGRYFPSMAEVAEDGSSAFLSCIIPLDSGGAGDWSFDLIAISWYDGEDVVVQVETIATSNDDPYAPGTASAGTSLDYARGDHRHPKELPSVTTSDNGKFLRVVSGAWAAQTVPSAESNSFGGGS